MLNEKLIAEIKEKALADRVPIMEDEGLEYMVQYLKNHHIGSLLEIGTAVGYSSIVFASSNPEMKILTLEINEERYQIAQENIKRANLTDRITSVLTDARLYDTDEMFDALFLDGPKAHNKELLNHYLKNLKDDGVILVDDVYFHGYVDHPELLQTRRLKPLVRKLTAFRNDMLNSEEFDSEYLEIGDGLLIAKRRK